MRTLTFIIGALIVLSVAILIGIGYIWREIAFVEYIPAPESERPRAESETTPTTSSEMQKQNPPQEPTPTITLPEPVTISIDSLPQGQRTLLEALGMDSASYTITPEVVQCAIDALGEERALAIQNGAVPTMAEGLTLIACLK